MTRLPEKLGTALDTGIRWIGAGLVAAFTAAVVYVVTSRYLAGHTPRWAEELPRLLLVWLTFLGAVSAFWRGTHFRAGLTDLLVSNPALRGAIRLLAAAATIIFLGVLAYNGAKLAQMTWSHTTTALSLPVGLFYLALPVACALSLIAFLLGGWRK